MRYTDKVIEVPPGRFASEKEYAAHVLGKLEPWFEVVTEVPGVACGGEAVQLDAVLVPRDPVPWFAERPALGVEFKHPDAVSQATDYRAPMAQAVSYTHVEWKGFGRLPIFLSPSPMRYLPGAREPRHSQTVASEVNGLLGNLNVGELIYVRERGWMFCMTGERVWSERDGVPKVPYSFRLRVGSQRRG